MEGVWEQRCRDPSLHRGHEQQVGDLHTRTTVLHLLDFFFLTMKKLKVLCAVSSGSVLSALRRRSAGDLRLADDPNLCFSLRENDDQRQLLCNDRRSKFNFNPFGLRFGKRYNGYIYRRAVKRARTKKFSPLTLFPREVEVPT